MRTALVQLSDLHFGGTADWLSDRAEALAAAVSAEDPSVSAYLLLFTGDIAYSGKKCEYAKAAAFVNALKSALSSRNNASVHVAFVPGNHDCDFDAESDTRALAASALAAQLSAFDLNGDVAASVSQFKTIFSNSLPT